MSPTGDVLVAENHDIRVINGVSNIIYTVSGSGTQGSGGDGGPVDAAQYKQPQQMAVDSVGNIYLADSQNNRIRFLRLGNSWTAPPGVVTGVAGGGNNTNLAYVSSGGAVAAALTMLTSPSAVALDPNSQNIYIADTGNNVIRKVNLATGLASVYAGNGRRGITQLGGAATSTSLSAPLAAATDLQGNLYIAIQTLNYLLMVNSSSLIISDFAVQSAPGILLSCSVLFCAVLFCPSVLSCPIFSHMFSSLYFTVLLPLLLTTL